MLTIPKGSSSGKVLRIKGRGFTDKDGNRGDQLVHARRRRARRTTRSCERFAEGWDGGGNPRAALGV